MISNQTDYGAEAPQATTGALQRTERNDNWLARTRPQTHVRPPTRHADELFGDLKMPPYEVTNQELDEIDVPRASGGPAHRKSFTWTD